MPKELTPEQLYDEQYHDCILRSFKVYRSAEQNAELERRLENNLPLQGDQDYQSMFSWRPGVARPFRDGERIIWQK